MKSDIRRDPSRSGHTYRLCPCPSPCPCYFKNLFPAPNPDTYLLTLYAYSAVQTNFKEVVS